MLTLEEVYNGCTKKMKISRRVLNDDGHTTSTREKILTINVKKGWREGTRITFNKEGDQGPNKIPGKNCRPMLYHLLKCFSIGVNAVIIQ